MSTKTYSFSIALRRSQPLYSSTPTVIRNLNTEPGWISRAGEGAFFALIQPNDSQISKYLRNCQPASLMSVRLIRCPVLWPKGEVGGACNTHRWDW